MSITKAYVIVRVLLFLLSSSYTAFCTDLDTGYFWQITDIHYDANYSEHGFARYLCHQHPFDRNTEVDFSVPGNEKHGKYGDYSCDSPWALVTSAVSAMKTLKPEVDFILWTGDNVPHVPDSELDPHKVFTVVKEVTDLLLKSFPSTPFYPTIGNHDSWPANQVPPSDQEQYYTQMADYAGWHNMLDDESLKTFRRGGFYSSRTKHGLWQIGLNTILWYSRDSLVGNLSDPADQFQWLEYQLESVRQQNETALLSGHVPPGYEPKGDTINWYYPHFNRRFLSLVQQYQDIIVGLIFGHEHKDNLHIVLDKKDKPVIPVFMAPAITPLNSTLPGVGANNPGVRLYTYSRDTGKILDFTQYYLNLSAANIQQKADWLEEYSATETYGITDVTADSLFSLVETFREHHSENFDKYYKYSTVSVDVDTKCSKKCKNQYICGILYIDYDDFEKCKSDELTFGVELESVGENEQMEITTHDEDLEDRKHHWQEHKHHHDYRPVPEYMYWIIWGLALTVIILFIVTIVACSRRQRLGVHLSQGKGYTLLVE